MLTLKVLKVTLIQLKVLTTLVPAHTEEESASCPISHIPLAISYSFHLLDPILVHIIKALSSWSLQINEAL